MLQVLRVFATFALWPFSGRRSLRFSLALAACLCLVSCSKEEPDTSYLDGTPCSVPCWQGITPGITEEETMLSILSDPTLVELDSVRRGSSAVDPNLVSYSFWRPVGGSVDIGLNEGIVELIRIVPDSELSLDRLLEALGNPDQIYVEESETDHGDDCYSATLFFLRKGARFRTSTCNMPGGEYEAYYTGSDLSCRISPEMHVNFLELVTPDAGLGSMSRHSLLMKDPDSARYVAQHANVWQGYGFYPAVPEWRFPSPRVSD